jgi:hypothetical protein
MIWHDDMSAIADIQFIEWDSSRFEHRHFVQQDGWVEDDAASDDVNGIWLEDTTWDKMKFKGSAIIDNRMAGVVAATITNDHVRTLAKKIDETAFAFIAPLAANNCHNWHGLILRRLRKGSNRNRKPDQATRWRHPTHLAAETLLSPPEYSIAGEEHILQ